MSAFGFGAWEGAAAAFAAYAAAQARKKTPTDPLGMLQRSPYAPGEPYAGLTRSDCECAYCGRRRPSIERTHSCKGCGAQEVK